MPMPSRVGAWVKMKLGEDEEPFLSRHMVSILVSACGGSSLTQQYSGRSWVLNPRIFVRLRGGHVA
jgi:hypothetical protein